MVVELSITLLFFIAVAAWTYLPFIPAVCELLDFGECEPVNVSPDADVDIRHHSKSFRESVNRRLAEPVAQCRAEHRQQEGRLEDGTPYRVLADNDEVAGTLGGPEPCKTMIVSTGRIVLPSRGVFFQEIYAEGAIHGGAGGVYRALLSDDSIELESGCRSLRWVDAGHVVRAREGSWLFGRVSAGELIELAHGCRFERMRAPRISLGGETSTNDVRGDEIPLTPTELLAHVEVAAGRWLIRRPVQVPAGRLIEADVVVRGEARLGRGTRIRGSVKSDKDLHLADGVIVEGSVVSARNVYIGAGCRISGPVLAEGDVRVEPGCHIGRPGHLTTLSARKMWLAPGNVVHGTIWAHEGGVVATMGTPLEAVS